MANRILVTTDLSTNSKAGIRFAIQLATQSESNLIFYYVIEQLKPTTWSKEKFRSFAEGEIKRYEGKLKRFVQGVYKQTGIVPGDYECVVQFGSPVDKSIINYALERKADYICMSTRGAGLIRRLVGTYTSAVLSCSPIPVLAIPGTYRRVPVSQILYASDLNDLQDELKKVIGFAESVNADVSVLYYDYSREPEKTKKLLSKIEKSHGGAAVKFYSKNPRVEKSLADNLQLDIRKFRPSVVAMVTEQNRDWFDRIFLPSKTSDLSFNSKVPLLVFRKNEKNSKSGTSRKNRAYLLN